MLQILNFIYVAVAVVLLFGAAVFVHEFGHYWVARRRGMKVEAFAIGFGPKIFGWTRDGIDYSWRWIPAGGYVRLPQMITSEALEGPAGTAAEPVPDVSPLSKILVALAGPFMNLVFAFVIATVIYFVGLPLLVNPSYIGYVEPNSAEAKLGIQAGDQIVAVDGRPVKSWQDVQMASILARTNILEVVIERNQQRTTYRLEATVNPVLKLKILNLEPRDHPEILEVTAGGAAAQAGLKAGDVILAFAGLPIASREQLIELIQKRAAVASEIRVDRAGQKLLLQVTPRQDPGTGTGRIGVSLGNQSANVYQVQRPGPTPWASVAEVWNKTVDTFSALFHSKQTGVGAKDLSGPVGILGHLADQVNRDYRLALNFMVLLNVSLAILNLLPVPVLDGGHITIALIEMISRRRVNVRVLEYTTMFFAALLITFFVYVSYNDLRRWPLFKLMFRQSVQIEQATPAAPTPALPR